METDGTVIIHQQDEGGARLINIDGLTVRVKAERLGLRPSARQAVFHSFDVEGDAVEDVTVALEDGWLDFSFLAQEQFALVLP